MIDNSIKKICKWFNKDRRIVFFVTFIVGMLVHFELYSNELVAYDGYWHYGSFLAKGWEISLGRFLIPFMDLLRGTVVSSTLISVIAISTISFTTLILTDLLKIKKTYIKILMGILLAVTPTFSLTLMYTYTADSYTYALAFSVLSVYFLNSNRNLKNTFFALICIIITLGFYQAYLCVTVTLCAIVYLINICKESETKFRDIIKKIAYDILIILGGIILYYIAYSIIVKILNLSITEYNGGNTILSIETLKGLLPAIKNTYITFYQFNFNNNIIENTEFVYRNVINVFMFLMITLNFIILIIQNKIYKKPCKLLLIIVILLMFPIFSSIIEIIAQAKSVNLLMASALYLPIILLLKQIELIKFDKVNVISILIVLISIWTFILTDNATYVAANLCNKQMTALGNRIIQRIESTEEITQDMPICIIGKMNFTVKNSTLLKLTNFDVGSINNISTWTWQIYLQDNVGLGRSIFENKSYEEIYNSEEYLNMGVFPSEDSIKIINGVAVVKISY